MLYMTYTLGREGNKTRFSRVGRATQSLEAAIKTAKKHKRSYVEIYSGEQSGKVVFINYPGVSVGRAA